MIMNLGRFRQSEGSGEGRPLERTVLSLLGVTRSALPPIKETLSPTRLVLKGAGIQGISGGLGGFCGP
jgi:hypothetical protein